IMERPLAFLPPGSRDKFMVISLSVCQDRKKCLKAVEQGTRVDQYFLRSKPSQSSEVQQQDKRHSLQNINPPVPEEEVGPDAEGTCRPSQPTAERKIQGRRPPIKWLKSHERREWESVNSDLCGFLDQLKGPADRKLDKMGELIYSYGDERIGIAGEDQETTYHSNQIQETTLNRSTGQREKDAEETERGAGKRIRQGPVSSMTLSGL
ncbi:hypothetical protein L3Q82_026848, partial [Scortum barcoo]